MAARPPPKAAAAPSSMVRPREDGSTKLDAAPRRIVVGPAHTNNNTNSGRSSVLPISTHEVVPAKEERRGLRPIHPSTAMSSRNPSVLSAYTPHVLHPQQQQRTEPRTSMSVNDEVEIEPLPPSMDRPDNASPRSISMPQCSSSSSQHVSCSTSPHAQRTSATTPSSHVIRRGPPPSRAGTSRRTPSLRDTLVQPTAPLYNNSNNSFQNPSMSSHDEATYPDSPRSSDDGDAVVPMSIDEHLRDEESEDCHTAPMTAAREHAYAVAHGHVHGPSPLHPPPPSHTTTGAILPIRDDLIQRLSDVAGIHSSSVAASRRPSSRRRSGRHHQHIIPHTSAPRRSTSPPNNIGIATASSPTTTPTAKTTTTTTTTPANITSSQSSAYRLPRILHHNNNNNNEGAPHHSHVASIDGRRDEPSSRSHTPGRRVPPEHTSYETRTTPHGKRIDQASRSTTTTTTISSSTRSEIDDGDDDDGLHRSTPTLTAHAVLPESIKPPPWSPVEALEYFGHCLTDYEHREIHGYTSIFYCASRAAALGSKSLSTPQPLPKHNKNVQHGDDHDDDGGADARFTDETGNYRIIIGDHIAFRYEVVDILGHGTFGIVLRVIDHAAVQESVHQRRTNNSSNGSSTNNKSPVFCALKIISANPLFTAAAAEEVQMLERLRPIFRHRTETEQRVACEWVSAASMDEHHVEGCTPPTAVSWQVAGGGLLNHFMFRQHRVLVFPLLGMDLSELLRVNGRRPLPMYVARSMCAQVARMISDIHACGVVHTDIKLDNVILVDRSAEDCSLPPLLSSSAREDGGEDRTSSSHRRISLGEFLNDESRLPSMIIPRTPPRVIPATVGLSSRELHLRIGSNSSSIDYPSVAQMHAEEQRQLQQQQHRHHHHQQQHRPPRHMKGGGTSSTFALHHHTAGAASIHYRPRSFGKAHQYASNNSNNGSSQKRGTHTTSRPTHVTNNLVLPTTPTSHSQRRGSLHTTTNTMELDGSFMQDAIAEDDLSVSSRVVVMDFGNAKMERAPPMFPVQSPFYRAPEAALKLPYDRAIDVWSLGCVLVELVCGQPLFQATGDVGLLQRHLDVLGLPDRPFLEHIKSTWRNYRDEHTYLKRLRHLRTNGTTTVGGVEDAEEAEADAQLASRSDEVKETEECWLSLLEMLSVKASQWRGDRTNNNNNNTTSPSLLELLRIDQAFLQRVAMRCRMSTSAHGSPSGLDHASMRLDELSRRVGSPDRGRRGEAEESLWLLMLDFVLGCLWWSPSERITADEATHHPFLSIFFFGNNNNNNTKKKKKVHDDDDVAMRSSSTRTSGFFFLTHHPLTAHWPALAEVAAEVVQLQGQLMQCGAQHMLNVEDETLSSIINIALAVFPLQQYPHTLEEALHLRIPHNNTMDHMLLSYGGVGGGSVGSSPRRPLSNETDGDAFLDLIGGVASLSGTVVVPTTATTTTMSGANNNNTNSNTPRGVASERPWRLGEASLYSANSSFLQLTNALEPPIRVSSSRSNLSMHYALNSIIPQQQQPSASPSSRNNNNGATPTTATTPGSGAEGLSFFFSDPTNHI